VEIIKVLFTTFICWHAMKQIFKSILIGNIVYDKLMIYRIRYSMVIKHSINYYHCVYFSVSVWGVFVSVCLCSRCCLFCSLYTHK